MKIKCVKCKKEDELGEEEVKLLSHIIKRYNPRPKPGDYTAVLSIIKGDCADNKKHLFVFDETFDTEVAGVIKEHNEAITANTARKENLEKTEHLIIETSNQIKSLESALKELERKKEYTISEMNSGEILVDNIKLKFEKLTGMTDTGIWS